MKTMPDCFFEALGNDSGEVAKGILHVEAFANGVDTEPSPRATAFVSEGEWDVHMLLALIPVEKDACFHIMPNLDEATFPLTPTYMRICGKSDCTAASHEKKKVPEEQRLAGWYVAVRNVNQCVLKELQFPKLEDGGPVTMKAMIALTPPGPFKMSIGGGGGSSIGNGYTQEDHLIPPCHLQEVQRRLCFHPIWSWQNPGPLEIHSKNQSISMYSMSLYNKNQDQVRQRQCSRWP